VFEGLAAWESFGREVACVSWELGDRQTEGWLRGQWETTLGGLPARDGRRLLKGPLRGTKDPRLGKWKGNWITPIDRAPFSSAVLKFLA
jgi:hypothetical protein